MVSERSRSAAVLCRSGWKRDAKARDVWSRSEVRESRAREDSRTPRRCRAFPRSRRGNEADPRRVESPPANGLRTVPECGSPLPLSLGTRRKRTRRLVPHGVREPRAREDSRTLQNVWRLVRRAQRKRGARRRDRRDRSGTWPLQRGRCRSASPDSCRSSGARSRRSSIRPSRATC